MLDLGGLIYCLFCWFGFDLHLFRFAIDLFTGYWFVVTGMWFVIVTWVVA